MDHVEPTWRASDALCLEELFCGAEDVLGAEVVAAHREVRCEENVLERPSGGK